MSALQTYEVTFSSLVQISLATYYSTGKLNQKTSVGNRGNEYTSLLRTQTLF